MTFYGVYFKVKRDWKMRLKKETQGTYPLLYCFLGLAIFMSCLMGVQDITEMGFTSIAAYVVTNSLAVYLLYIRPILYTLEKGKDKPILGKYRNTPIDMGLLCRAKLLVIVLKLGKVSFISFLMALFIRVLEGGDFSSPGLLFIPLIWGINLAIYTAGCLWWQYKKVME
ncbi:MAG: hypothetical protein MR383_03570 [Lachnospiraceae bacterium]|nr:hypothetical protein [Lachnospiraceae bacterium]MDY5701816.1 hypothetical protein [Lachnospiraceae bacterium]